MPDEPHTTESRAGGGSARPSGCMVVDDHPDIRALIRVILDATNGEFVVRCEASNGHEAVANIAACNPQVVVIDEMMPGMDGLETVALIRAERPAQRFVLCSAYLDDELRARAVAAGVHACIGKEEVFDLPQVVRAVAGAH